MYEMMCTTNEHEDSDELAIFDIAIGWKDNELHFLCYEETRCGLALLCGSRGKDGTD